MNELPGFVVTFLQEHKKMHELEQTLAEQRQLLRSMETPVSEWLRSNNCEVKLDFGPHQTAVIGEPGKLRFALFKRREYLSKNALVRGLFSFFSTMNPDRQHLEIEKLATSGGEHVWQSRKVVSTVPVVQRTFRSTKRKRDTDL